MFTAGGVTYNAKEDVVYAKGWSVQYMFYIMLLAVKTSYGRQVTCIVIQSNLSMELYQNKC